MRFVLSRPSLMVVLGHFMYYERNLWDLTFYFVCISTFFLGMFINTKVTEKFPWIKGSLLLVFLIIFTGLSVEFFSVAALIEATENIIQEYGLYWK